MPGYALTCILVMHNCAMLVCEIALQLQKKGCLEISKGINFIRKAPPKFCISSFLSYDTVTGLHFKIDQGKETRS